MNKNINCNACEELNENASDFAQNGVTKTVCNSLKNDTGFNPSLTTQHTDCEDLDTANDCLIGMMETELNTMELCDWKKFMKNFIPNLHQFLKAVICAICGIWTNIHNLWEQIEELWCNVNFLFKGASFSVTENTSGDAYAVAGKGVSFLIPQGGDEHTGDLGLIYIAGGLIRGTGSFKFFTSDFTDRDECGNYDNNGVNYQTTKSRLGNSVWGNTGRPANGGELICEFRIKKSKYPQLKNLYNGFGQETGGGAYHVTAIHFTAGDFAYGQHGWCDSDGTPSEDGYSRGHEVPDGWIFIQIRLTYALMVLGNGDGIQRSPAYFMGVRMNQDKIEC